MFSVLVYQFCYNLGYITNSLGQAQKCFFYPKTIYGCKHFISFKYIFCTFQNQILFLSDEFIPG